MVAVRARQGGCDLKINAGQVEAFEDADFVSLVFSVRVAKLFIQGFLERICQDPTGSHGFFFFMTLHLE